MYRFRLIKVAGKHIHKKGSESFAGRIAYFELTPFTISEVYPEYDISRLWMKGGFPDPFLNDRYWLEWMNNFVKTYFERDLPNLGFPADPITGERLWTMLAHLHGNLINYAELGKSLDLSIHTVKKYIGFLECAFLIRTIKPYFSNLKKRLVKSPKVYIRDSGIMHYLSGIENTTQLYGNPKKGASWEGFVIEQIFSVLTANRKVFFYRTHDGVELDLVIIRSDHIVAAIEIKFGSGARMTRGNTEALRFLHADRNYLIVNEDADYEISGKIRVCGLWNFLSNYMDLL